MKLRYGAAVCAIVLATASCSSPSISTDTSSGPNTTVGTDRPTSRVQSSNELSAGLTKQQQYLNKYHQLMPADKSSDDAILDAAKKFCDESAPASAVADPMSQLVAFWQQLNCPA
jgi:hypothetical protein